MCLLVIYTFHWCLCLKNLDGFTVQDGMNAIQSMLFNSHNENGFNAFISVKNFYGIEFCK